MFNFDFFVHYFIYNINYWYPWLTFFYDIWLIQLFIIYVLYLIFSTLNIYYVLLYLFLEIFLFGLFIGMIQFDFFTGFLWVIECTVIFIALILLFYLNIEGIQIRFNLKIYRFYYVFTLFLVFLLFNNMFYINNYEFYLPIIFNNIDLWDDFYESLFNINMNDFRALTVMYYSVNSIEFILIGLILLIGSLICVCLNKIQKLIRIFKYTIYFNIFNYFKDYMSFTFIRKQNLINQSIYFSSVRIFKKK